jgi:mannose/fructose/N-acetylgalactosamine-specific phosphotransferase system component IIB
MEKQPMKKIAYFGIDYHINSISIAVMIDGETKIHQTIHLVNEDKVVFKFLKKLSLDFEVKGSYEESNVGYAFQRKMKTWG